MLLPWTLAMIDIIRPLSDVSLHRNYKFRRESPIDISRVNIMKGNFSVQVSDDNSFGKLEVDKVIEITINRDTKTPGCTTGKTSPNLY